MKAMTWAVSGFGMVMAAGIGLVAFGRSRWKTRTQAQKAKLEAARVPALPGRYEACELRGLHTPNHLPDVHTQGQGATEVRLGDDARSIQLNGRLPVRGDRIEAP